MPSLAAWIAISWNAATSSAGTSSPVSPYELETICAQPLATTALSATSSVGSRQSAPPTYRMCAPGAIACTASTSRVSSPYQPSWSHFLPFRPCSLWLSGMIACENCPGDSGCDGSLIDAYVDASWKMVGDAKASMIATVADFPVVLPSTVPV